jgi:hypothetical protein
MTLEPPVTYQGGKTRIASAIADLLLAELKPGQDVCDLCCGCGAVSLALVRKGLAPNRITMVDVGPWGDFWEKVGVGTFDLVYFRELVASLPKDPRHIKMSLEGLAKTDASRSLAVYAFLLLQAGSFGGKPVSIEGRKWRVHGFRDYWLPTATSNRRSHVNPMMPMPETLLSRVEEIVVRMRGVRGFQKDVNNAIVRKGSLVYIDPVYAGLTSGYASDFGVVKSARWRADMEDCVVLVSEAKPLGKEAVKLAGPRAKGGVSGKRAKAHEEWVTWFRP